MDICVILHHQTSNVLLASLPCRPSRTQLKEHYTFLITEVFLEQAKKSKLHFLAWLNLYITFLVREDLLHDEGGTFPVKIDGILYVQLI